MGVLKLVLATAVLLQVGWAQNAAAALPIVDLGYEIYQASNFNASGRYYNFSNIRYAAPPLGNLRFAPPQAPATNRSSVQPVNIGRVCPQGFPAWSDVANEYVNDLYLNKPYNRTTPYDPPPFNDSTPLPPLDPWTTEDCLFLDVYVPQKILQSAGNASGAPVLVWVYGGGYVSGGKYYNPSGLLASSGNSTSAEVIYIAFNYRLGAFGWNGGPTFQSQGGVSNLGFLDQRFAFEWVQKYIHLFGGDPNRVTVFGESAGGGSIMHQITAYGGSKGPVPFQQAISQSPGWIPVGSQSQQDDVFLQFMNITKTTSLAELRNLSSEKLIRANYFQILGSNFGGFAYGPLVDGDFVPQQPGQLLAQGRYDKNVRVIVGHNTNEAAYFTAPTISSDDAIKAQISGILPYIPDDALDNITTTLYPPVFDGTYPYRTQLQRAQLIVAEFIFTCNTYYLGTAFDNKTYAYVFAVPPGTHALDVSYTYFQRGAVYPIPPYVQNRTIANALQDFITSFAKDGRPHAAGVRDFNMYGPDARVLQFNITGIDEVRDVNANERCKWWQKALYT